MYKLPPFDLLTFVILKNQRAARSNATAALLTSRLRAFRLLRKATARAYEASLARERDKKGIPCKSSSE